MCIFSCIKGQIKHKYHIIVKSFILFCVCVQVCYIEYPESVSCTQVESEMSGQNQKRNLALNLNLNGNLNAQKA